MQIFKTITLVLLTTFLLSCSSGSVIVTGKTRPAISPSEVKIYLDKPSQYETVGTIEASSEIDFFRQSAQDRVINELKVQAAKTGANGVLLVDSGSKSSGMYGFTSGSSFYAIEGEKITAQARAIHVIQE